MTEKCGFEPCGPHIGPTFKFTNRRKTQMIKKLRLEGDAIVNKLFTIPAVHELHTS